MSINEKSVSNQLFKTLKSHGLTLRMYTFEGEHTLNIDYARRFYSKDSNIMLNFDTSSEYNAINFDVGQGVDISEIRSLITQLRKLANKYVLEFNLKSIGKVISPKDYVTQIEKIAGDDMSNSVTEGFSKPFGTIKTSKQQFENATLYIRHTKSIDENIRGSRSRNIHSIFVENNRGERFRFPYNNVPAARAMTVHVSEGGSTYDNHGKHILNITEESNKLKNFLKSTRKDAELHESHNEFINEVYSRVAEVKKTLASMHNVNGYQKYFESYTDDDEEEVVDESLLEMFTEEMVSDILPHLGKIKETMVKKQGYRKELSEMVKAVLESGGLNSHMLDKNESNHPCNVTYGSKIDETVDWFNYLAQKTTDHNIAEALMKIAENYRNYPAEMHEKANNILTSLHNSIIVNEEVEDAADNKSEQEAISHLKESLDKFRFERIFDL